MKEKKLKKGEVNIEVKQDSPEHRRLKEATKKNQFERAYYKFIQKYYSPHKREKTIDLKNLSDLYIKISQLAECVKIFLRHLEEGNTQSLEDYNSKKFSNYSGMKVAL